MHVLFLTIHPPRLGGLLLSVAMVVGLGCVPLDDEAATGLGDDRVRTRSAAPGKAGPEEAEGPEDSIDKALRKDFCCAVKTGNRVNKCYDARGTKAWIGTTCNAKGFDSVVRDGHCSQYASCEGKIACFDVRGTETREVPCDELEAGRGDF